jgi:glycosyltransferase involved in cell wall biosynthesis
MLTVGIPTVERLGYLEELLRTLQAQTDRRFEIVVSQDLDLPKVTEWCQENAGRYNFRFKKNTCRQGLAGNWNSIVEAAQCTYTAILGDDDRVSPTFVAETLNAAGDHADLVFCEQNTIDENGCRLGGEQWDLASRYGRNVLTSGPIADPLALAWRNAIPMTGSIIRTDLLRKHPFNTDLNTPELEFFVRALSEKSRVIYVPHRLVDYRMHGNSATSTGLRNDRLVAALMGIVAPPHVERQKRQLLDHLLINGISRAVAAGNSQLARRMLESHYFSGGLRGTYFKALLALGTPLASVIHRSVRTLKNRNHYRGAAV